MKTYPTHLLVVFVLCVPFVPLSTRTSFAQPATNSASPRPAFGGPNPETELDHRRMMDALNITTLRRGRDGLNTNSPYYANYDESKANLYLSLPDPLILKDGRNVTSADVWWHQRRPEIVEDFDREIYGRVPARTPAVHWEVTGMTRETNGDISVLVSQLIGHVDNSSFPAVSVNIQLTLGIPAEARKPVPVIMQFGFNFGNRLRGGPPGSGRTNSPASTNATARPGFLDNGPNWQHQVLSRGWAYAVLFPYSVQADNGAGLTKGIIGLCNKGQPRKPDDWGALRAWAWGASRAMDYFETNPALDAKRVGIEGHSRFGKATLVTMAYDRRFAIAYVSSSGEGGAKLHRRNWGETVENLTGSGEYHWMAGNFIKYGGPLNWGDLPVDSHELIALCAPRPVFVSAGATQGDGWVDAKGSFMAAAAAGPVYRLLGAKDMGTITFPPIETSLMIGDITFRQHSAGHTDAPNWPVFLKFVDRYFE